MPYPRVNAPRLLSLAPVAALALLGCRRGAGGQHTAPSASASAPPAASGSGSAAAPPRGSAVADEPPAGSAPTSTFVGAKSEKACRAQTVELATYQTRGDVALAGQGEALAAAWRVRLGGKREEQVAFATFDKDGHPVARPRGVGATTHDIPPRVLGAEGGWAVVWFDDKGLAYARPGVQPLPPPEVAHLGAFGSEVAADVALAQWPAGGGIAAAPFGADKAQLGLFFFGDGGAVKAMGVTHHAKQPHAPALASGAGGTFIAWEDGGALVASRFDAAGKEATASACTIAAKGPARERLSLAVTASGAVAVWIEGASVRARAIDASGCPASPIWTVAEGKWATVASLGDGALLAWVASDGRLLAARLGASGAPPARGLDAGEGTSGVKDPPAVLVFGGRAAFGWSEVMSPVIRTKRIDVRIVDAACIP